LYVCNACIFSCIRIHVYVHVYMYFFFKKNEDMRIPRCRDIKILNCRCRDIKILNWYKDAEALICMFAMHVYFRVYVYMYMYICTCIYLHIYLCICIHDVWLWVDVYMHIYLDIYLPVHIYISVCVYIYYIQISIRLYIYVYNYVRILYTHIVLSCNITDSQFFLQMFIYIPMQTSTYACVYYLKMHIDMHAYYEYL